MKELILKFNKELWINHRLLFDLNDMLRMASTHWGKLNSEKQKVMMVLGSQARIQNKEKLCFDKPSKINFIFLESKQSSGKDRDFDNITSAGHKVILDMLKKCNIIKDDDNLVIREMRDKVFYGCKHSKIIIRIIELGAEEIQKYQEEREIFDNE